MLNQHLCYDGRINTGWINKSLNIYEPNKILFEALIMNSPRVYTELVTVMYFSAVIEFSWCDSAAGVVPV